MTDMTEAPAPDPTAAGSWTVVVLAEVALAEVDVTKILGLHAERPATYRVLVPADTDRNVLTSVLDHLSLLEMREAVDAMTSVDVEQKVEEADEALAVTVQRFTDHGAIVTGEVVGDDPMPLLAEEVARLEADEVIIVTRPHAVEDTFHTDWASDARAVFDVPVLHMYAGDWRLG